MSAIIKRIRVEATGTQSDHVEKALRSFLDSIPMVNEEWGIEDPGVEIQTYKNGFWGRITARRDDE